MNNSSRLPAVMESLQSRMLLSATLKDGVLAIRGTEGDDCISFHGEGRGEDFSRSGDDLLEPVDSLSRIISGRGADSLIASSGRDIVVGGSWLHIRRNGTAVVHGSDKADSI